VFARAFISGGCTNLNANALAIATIYARMDPHCYCGDYAHFYNSSKHAYRKAYGYYTKECSASNYIVKP